MPTNSTEYEKARQLYAELCQTLVKHMPSDVYFEVMDKVTLYGSHLMQDTRNVYQELLK